MAAFDVPVAYLGSAEAGHPQGHDRRAIVDRHRHEPERQPGVAAEKSPGKPEDAGEGEPRRDPLEIADEPSIVAGGLRDEGGPPDLNEGDGNREGKTPLAERLGD